LNNSGEIGDLVYDTVRLDGRNLFEVAATRTSTGEQDARGTGALEVRIERVENRLRQVRNQTVAEGQALEDDQIVVNELNAQMVVQAVLDKTSTPLSIVTVTNSDVEIYGLPAPTWQPTMPAKSGSGWSEPIKNGSPSTSAPRSGGLPSW
jgi:hypothetical protein